MCSSLGMTRLNHGTNVTINMPRNIITRYGASRRAAAFTNRTDDFIGRIGTIHVIDSHFHPFSGQSECNCTADAPCCPGHQCDFALQSEIRVYPPADGTPLLPERAAAMRMALTIIA